MEILGNLPWTAPFSVNDSSVLMHITLGHSGREVLPTEGSWVSPLED